MDDKLFNPQDIAQATSPATNATQNKKMSAKKIDETAGEFESMFLAQMLSPMWQGLETDGLFGGGQAEETYRGMLINEYGSLISKAGGVGIASAVKSELLKLQETKG